MTATAVATTMCTISRSTSSEAATAIAFRYERINDTLVPFYELFTEWLESCPDIIMHSHSIERHSETTCWIHCYVLLEFSDGQRYEYVTGWPNDTMRRTAFLYMLADIAQKTGWNLFKDLMGDACPK